MGEDEKLMPFLDMASLACGFHAADPLVMQASVSLCKKWNVRIGAHPGYPDLQGFGRRAMSLSPKDIFALVIYQCAALQGFCTAEKVSLSFVKPHGALYLAMMEDVFVFDAILSAIKAYNPKLKLMLLSSPKNAYFAKQAAAKGIGLLYEIFADRAYSHDGSLLARHKQGALIQSPAALGKRLKKFMETKKIETIDGNLLSLKADALCVHGDGKTALSLLRPIRKIIR